MDPYCIYIATYYLILRFMKITSTTKDILITIRKFKQNSLNLDRSLLQILKFHNELSVEVLRYNKRWSWSIFTSYCILMPIFAVNVLGLFFLDMPIYVSGMMAILLFDHLMLLWVILGMSSSLYQAAHKVYQSLCSIAARSGKLQYHTRFKVKVSSFAPSY